MLYSFSSVPKFPFAKVNLQLKLQVLSWVYLQNTKRTFSHFNFNYPPPFAFPQFVALRSYNNLKWLSYSHYPSHHGFHNLSAFSCQYFTNNIGGVRGNIFMQIILSSPRPGRIPFFLDAQQTSNIVRILGKLSHLFTRWYQPSGVMIQTKEIRATCNHIYTLMFQR